MHGMSDADSAAAAERPRRPGPRRKAKPGQTYGFSTLFKDSAIYGSGRALQKLLNMLLLPLYTAYLTKEDYGVLGMVTTFALLVDVIITLGWDVVVARFYFDDDDETHRKRVITQTFFVDTVWPACVIGLMVAFMPQVSRAVMGDSWDSSQVLLFDLALVSLFLVNINDIPMQLFRLDHKPKTFAFWTISRVFVQVPVNVLFVAGFHWGVKGVLLGNLIATALLLLACLRYWVRRLHFSWEPLLMKSMLAFGIANFFANISFYVLNFSDRYLLNRLGGLGDVGIYQVAFQLAMPVYFAGYAFRMAWPQWHYSFLKDPPQHKMRVARGFTYFTLMSAVLIVLVGVFLPLEIRVLLRRPAFWNVGSIVLALIAARAFFNSYHLFLVGVNVTKKNRGLPVLVLAAAGVSITLNLIMIPRYGAMGAALTNATSFFLLAAAMRQLSQHYYPIPHEWSRVARIALAVVATLFSSWAILQATGFSIDLPFDQIVWRQMVAAPALLVFPLALWLTRVFTAEEKRALRDLSRRALHPRGRAAEAGGAAGGASGLAAIEAAAESDLGAEPPADAVEADLSAGTASEDELAAEEERMEEAWETGLPGDRGGTV